jgi:hypothetical protein
MLARGPNGFFIRITGRPGLPVAGKANNILRERPATLSQT